MKCKDKLIWAALQSDGGCFTLSLVRPCPGRGECCAGGVWLWGLLLLLIKERTLSGYHLQIFEGEIYVPLGC